jgi:2-oxoglutarate ferredoxin oxidoreductase subunit beta
MNDSVTIKPLTPEDFESDQELRWCPGCGDYAIIKGVRKALAEIGTPPHQVAFVSGIGCAARFPYYMASYGFHTIHGRAPAIATGVKLANPALDVWVVGGDGDMLSIGGNHTLHAIRRNIDITMLLFNNEIYGLTKGQYSPTSRMGTRSPSTPFGSVDYPVSPIQFALGAGGHFVARTADTMQKHLPEVLKRAHAFRGASFVEILQNCIVYNDGVFESVTAKQTQADNAVLIEHGKPIRFGKSSEKGLRFEAKKMALEIVVIGEGGVSEADLVVHDETNRTLANMLGQMEPPEFPKALGVIYCAPAESYDHALVAQIEAERAKAPKVDLNTLLRRGHTWQVGPSA